MDKIISGTNGRIELGKHIVADPEIGSGKPTFKGTRKSVDNIIRTFERGHTVDEVAQKWNLPAEAVIEALQLAARAVREHYRSAPLSVKPPADQEVDMQREAVVVGASR
jgi:uncharacterized protein (DUF433 family)